MNYLLFSLRRRQPTQIRSRRPASRPPAPSPSTAPRRRRFSPSNRPPTSPPTLELEAAGSVARGGPLCRSSNPPPTPPSAVTIPLLHHESSDEPPGPGAVRPPRPLPRRAPIGRENARADHSSFRHKSLIAYLTANNLADTAAALRTELNLGEDQFDAATAKKYEGLLEKKWTAVVRLQKKVCAGPCLLSSRQCLTWCFPPPDNGPRVKKLGTAVRDRHDHSRLAIHAEQRSLVMATKTTAPLYP
jgi:hypothetical protein